MFQAKHWGGDLACGWSRKSHYANATAPRRRRDGDDRVVKVHGAIVAVKLGEQPAAGLRKLDCGQTNEERGPEHCQSLTNFCKPTRNL
jgi:hypothetical protein